MVMIGINTSVISIFAEIGNIILFLQTMVFRLQARHIALTYPQAKCDKESLFNFLLGIENVAKVLVAQELHADGGVHFHCYVGFRSHPRSHITCERFFDWQGNHPNFQGVRNVKDWLKYCTKEDLAPLANFTISPDEVFKQIVIDCDAGLNPNEIFRNAVIAQPSLIKNGSSIMASITYLSTKNKLPSDPKYPFSSFVLPFEFELYLLAWKDRLMSMVRGDRSYLKSMWFTGPSMTGKTSLARSLGTHWYMGTNWNLKNICDKDHVYGVLDDVDWESIKWNYKALLGRQVDVTFTDKYCRKTEYKFGYPVIICTNTLPEFTSDERDWLRLNVVFWKFDSQVIPGSLNSQVFMLYV